jgi:hypothetical protein
MYNINIFFIVDWSWPELSNEFDVNEQIGDGEEEGDG